MKSLYRGMASPLYGVAAMNAIGFGVYGNVIRRLNNPDSITSITTAGVAAGGVQVSTIIKMRHLAQLFLQFSTRISPQTKSFSSRKRFRILSVCETA